MVTETQQLWTNLSSWLVIPRARFPTLYVDLGFTKLLISGQITIDLLLERLVWKHIFHSRYLVPRTPLNASELIAGKAVLWDWKKSSSPKHHHLPLRLRAILPSAERENQLCWQVCWLRPSPFLQTHKLSIIVSLYSRLILISEEIHRDLHTREVKRARAGLCNRLMPLSVPIDSLNWTPRGPLTAEC